MPRPAPTSTNLANPNVPTGLTAITARGDDPAFGDVLSYVSLAGTTTNLDLATSTITETGRPTVSYTTQEEIRLTGTATSVLSVTGTADPDIFRVTSTVTLSGTVTTPDVPPSVVFENYRGGLTFSGGGGFDELEILGNNAQYGHRGGKRDQRRRSSDHDRYLGGACRDRDARGQRLDRSRPDRAQRPLPDRRRRRQR